jgi:GPH family glycoside/pentoside/hexuronide:cation symporter
VAKDAPHDEINGMRWISALLGLIIIGTAFVAARFTKERFSHANAKKAHVDIIPAIKATLKCRPFAILLSYRLFQIFMERVPTQGLFLYVAIYILCSGDKTPATKLFGLAGTGALILSFPALWSLKPLTSWVGKKTTQIGSAALSFVIALSLPLFLHAANPNWFLAPWLLCLLLATVNAAMISAMLPDICDLDELENDQRREGLFTAVLSFVVKIGISISVLIVGVFLSWAGLHAKETVQSPDFISKLFWFTVATNIVLSGLHLLFTALFPITPKMMAEVRAQLDERRLLKAEQGIPTDEVVEEYVHEHPELLKGDDSSQNKNPQNS